MFRIIVKELIGSNIAVSMQLGDKLYRELREKLVQENKIIIDFCGVDTFATPFFNSAIGRLLKDYNIELLKQKLSFSNITEGGRNLLNRVIANAIDYYANPEPMIKIAEVLVED